MQENEDALLTEDKLKKYLTEGEGADILQELCVDYDIADDCAYKIGERLAAAIYAWMEAGCPAAGGDDA